MPQTATTCAWTCSPSPTRDRLVVEYALRGLAKPIGVAEWETRIVESLPDELKGSLPKVEELERELLTSDPAEE